MRIAILKYSPAQPRECAMSRAVVRAAMEPIEILMDGTLPFLPDYDGYIVMDDFSSSQPFTQHLLEQNELGKPILGIGNGAYGLVKTGLVPGLKNNAVGLALTEQQSLESLVVTVRLGDSYQYNAFTRRLSPTVILPMTLYAPISHFVLGPALLAEMQANGLTVFSYCDEQGKLQKTLPATQAIAAISNKAGNIMAMVPHPEQHPQADMIFQSLHDYIQKGYKQKVEPLHYQPR